MQAMDAMTTLSNKLSGPHSRIEAEDDPVAEPWPIAFMGTVALLVSNRSRCRPQSADRRGRSYRHDAPGGAVDLRRVRRLRRVRARCSANEQRQACELHGGAESVLAGRAL